MDEWEPAYTKWQTSQNADDLHDTVQALQRVIQRSVASVGASNDPAVMAKARLLAANAVRSYSPEHGANLPTWVSHGLTPLRRFKRLGEQTLQVPERVQLDAYNLDVARKKFIDTHNREPDDIELGDAAQMTQRRIRHIRSAQFSMPGEGALEGGTSQLLRSQADFTGEAMDYVYRDSNKVDRILLEGRTGYNGKPVLPTEEILKRTKLSPFQLSRRTAALTMRIQKTLGDLEGANS